MPEHWVGLALFAAAAMLTTSVAHAQAAPAQSGRSARSPYARCSFATDRETRHPAGCVVDDDLPRVIGTRALLKLT